jgi:3-dehydroquinate synthase
MSPIAHTVSLGDRAYEVRIGNGISHEAVVRAAAERAKGRVVVTVTSPGVQKALPALVKALAEHGPVIVTQADGETAKSSVELARIWEGLAAAGMGRDGTVIALGGGVVGDLAGFAAASYLRGVSFIQIPTTLLAMVDSSVGGKTGINLPQGKNLAGAFHQPQVVLADTQVLEGLPKREFAAGVAEVIKYGLLGDSALLAKLESAGCLAWNHPELASIILRCVEMKASIVAKDERETAETNGRALLNLGHTFGHAIEAVAGYGTYLHGEAIAVGLSMAATLSQDLGFLSPAQVKKVHDVLTLNGLPVRLTKPLSADDLMAAMRRDKKARSGTLRFIVMQQLGTAVTHDSVPELSIRKALVAGGAA